MNSDPSGRALRAIRTPWWASLIVLVALLGGLVALQWRENARRAAEWRSETRRPPSPLTDYQGIDESTLLALQRANEELVERLPLADPSGALARNELACIYALQEKDEQAAELFRQALRAHWEVLGADHEDTRIIQRNLAAVPGE